MTTAERERLTRLHCFEEELWKSGACYIGGIDEVGRGPLAGPVVAACVIIDAPLFLVGLNDSKKVSERRREHLAREIVANARAIHIGSASVAEIDRLNIGHATRLAMERALAGVTLKPDIVLIDAMHLPSYQGRQRSLIDGDALSAAIAAASIVAKVHRDAHLHELDAAYPQYGFARHKGYGTAAHIAALREHGACEHHRKSFAPVRSLIAR